jgi:hypothetical protein
VRIEIRATYPATDGSMPEDVTVEIADITELSSGEVIVAINAVLDRMYAAPRRRNDPDLRDAVSLSPAEQRAERDVVERVETEQRNALPKLSAAWPEEKCKRLVCGHGRSVHGIFTRDGLDVGKGNGKCIACQAHQSGDQCPSYVGANEETA